MNSKGIVNLHNLFSLYSKVARVYFNSIIVNSPNFKVIRTENSEWPNIAFDLNEKNLDSDRLKELIAEMGRLNMVPLLIVNEDARPYQLFRKSGLMPIEQWTGMYHKDLDQVSDFEGNEEVLINVIERNELPGWTAIVSRNLFGSKPISPELFNELENNNAELIGLRFQNSLIGTSMIHYNESDSAGIYMVCIEKEYRQKGFGKYLIAFCLNSIRKKNFKTCYLQSTKMGIPLYLSQGFEKAGNYLLYKKIK